MSPRTNHKKVKGANGVYMIGLCDALDGLGDTKSPIAFGVGLGEGMPCNVVRPHAIIPNYESHIETIVSSGRLSLIFISTII
jgi:hypothetical protein